MFKGEPFKSRTIYVVCSSRNQLESLVDTLRDEGFRSPDFRALVGLPSTSGQSNASGNTTPSTQMHADRWISGVPTTVIPSGAPKPSQQDISPYEPALYEYLSRGGLLLEVFISSVEQMQIFSEITEDLGTDWLESRSLKSESSGEPSWDQRQAA